MLRTTLPGPGALLLVACVLTPNAWAAPKKAPILATLAAEHLRASVRDVTILATAVPNERENSPGSAAIVRVDDGRDGGLPDCHLLVLAGRPATPGKIDAALRLTTCPRGEQKKGSSLQRISLSGRHDAWLAHLESQRYDSMAKGAEHAKLWAIVGQSGVGAEPRLLFERTSVTFKSPSDPKLNQAETCQAPVVKQGAQEPEGLEITCDTETMLGNLPKKQRQTFRYLWAGDRFTLQ